MKANNLFGCNCIRAAVIDEMCEKYKALEGMSGVSRCTSM